MVQMVQVSALVKSVCRAALALSLTAPASAAPPLPTGPEIPVSTDPTRGHHLPAVAVFPDGGFVVVWSTDFGELQARFFDRRGAATGDAQRLAVGTATYIEDVLAEHDGSFLVVANQSGPGQGTNVMVRRFGRDGAPRGKALRANAPRVAYRGSAVLATAPGGGFAVAWRSEVHHVGPGGTYLDTVARIFDARGRPLTTELVLLAGLPGSPEDIYGVNASPLGLALASDGTLTLLAQHDGACGRNFLLRLQPGASTPVPVDLGTAACASPSRSALAVGRDGTLIAVWRELDLEARRYAPNGAPRGAPFAVSESPTHAQVDPTAALQAGGSFVVAWAEGGGRDGDGSGIYARAFAYDGTALTADFQVNASTSGDQFRPRIAAARRGPAVVVWMQRLEPLARPHVFARVLAAAEAP